MGRQQSSEPETKPTSLVALNSEFQSIANELTAAGGELTEDSEKRLDAVVTALCEKADGYGVVQDQLEHQAEYWKYQKTTCHDAEKAIRNGIQRLKDRMKFVLRTVPGECLQGELYRFFLTHSADTLEIDAQALPPSWMKTEIKVVPDRERIEEAISKGETIPGVTRIVDNKALRVGRPK